LKVDISSLSKPNFKAMKTSVMLLQSFRSFRYKEKSKHAYSFRDVTMLLFYNVNKNTVTSINVISISTLNFKISY